MTHSALLYNSMTVEDYPPSPAASGGRVGLAATPEAVSGAVSGWSEE